MIATWGKKWGEKVSHKIFWLWSGWVSVIRDPLWGEAPSQLYFWAFLRIQGKQDYMEAVVYWCLNAVTHLTHGSQGLWCDRRWCCGGKHLDKWITWEKGGEQNRWVCFPIIFGLSCASKWFCVQNYTFEYGSDFLKMKAFLPARGHMLIITWFLKGVKTWFMSISRELP